MAVQAVNRAVEAADLAPERASQTRHTPLAGGDAYQPDPGRLRRDYGFAEDIARHLDRAFGTDADRVAKLAGTGLGGRLAPRHPYLEAEVVHAARHEAACTVDDIVSRRTRLAFLDSDAARSSVPRVAALLARELGWSEAEERRQVRTATARLEDQRRTARAALARA
jgi:glycerol-3-phosphate dehydrogenase